jgi:sec-independent protein translocase protein TatC
MAQENLTIIQHLEELRRRIIKSIILVGASSLFCYSLTDLITPILLNPVGKAVFISVQEPFVTNIKLSLICGIFVSSPFLIYRIWGFASLGLNPNERKYVLIFWPLSFILFIIGLAFSYFIMIPIGIKFILGSSSNLIIPMITISSYVSFVSMLTLVFGAVFELPLIMLFLAKIGITKPALLVNRRREAIVLIFTVAAVLTPPDVVSQVLLALPLLVSMN